MSDSLFARTKATSEGMGHRGLLVPWRHFLGEVEELSDEVEKHLNDYEPGDDGIKGEIMDCMNCLIDMYQQHYPDATEEEFTALFQKKLDKWRAVYFKE